MNRPVSEKAKAGERLDAIEAKSLVDCDDFKTLMEVARSLRDAGHGSRISYSRKVFISPRLERFRAAALDFLDRKIGRPRSESAAFPLEKAQKLQW